MAAVAVAVRLVHAGRQETTSGATDPAVSRISGVAMLLGALAVTGVLLPLLVPRQFIGRPPAAEPRTVDDERPAQHPPPHDKLLP